jgi:hypothetical protein
MILRRARSLLAFALCYAAIEPLFDFRFDPANRPGSKWYRRREFLDLNSLIDGAAGQTHTQLDFRQSQNCLFHFSSPPVPAAVSALQTLVLTEVLSGLPSATFHHYAWNATGKCLAKCQRLQTRTFGSEPSSCGYCEWTYAVLRVILPCFSLRLHRTPIRNARGRWRGFKNLLSPSLC